MEKSYISKIVDAAIQEDLLDIGDITSSCVLNNEEVCFSINSREELMVCGLPIARHIFDKYIKKTECVFHKNDGDFIDSNVTLISGRARAADLFSTERVILNFLQHASGIASITNKFVKTIEGTGVAIRDTRKTSPGLRILEKYATNIGGAKSYRMGLYDKVMIKDNHIASCGSISLAVQKIRDRFGENVEIMIECDTLEQVDESVKQNAHTILLDNMNLEQINEAVNRINKKSKIEVSGGINLNNIRKIAETGIDYISVGFITHSSSNKDIGLDVSKI